MQHDIKETNAHGAGFLITYMCSFKTVLTKHVGSVLMTFS